MADVPMTQAVTPVKAAAAAESSNPPDAAIAPLARATVMQMLNGYVNTQIIYTTAKLGLVELLAVAPQTCAELAYSTGLEKTRLHRLLRGGVRCGLLTEEADGHFTMTPLGATLQRDVAGSVYEVALLTGEEWYPAWSALYHTVQTGETAFEHVFGESFFTYLADHPAAKSRFNHYMASRTRQVVNELVRAYDFSQVKHVVDIGGGNGTLITALLQSHPHLNGTVFDAPGVIDEAWQNLTSAGLTAPNAARAEAIGGDFFANVPEGGDLYVLSQILHDWDDEQCVQILQKCRHAMRAQGRVLILEQIMPPQVHKSSAVVDMDLAMLILTGGRERTIAEYQALFAAAGLRLNQTLATRITVVLVEGVAGQR